MRILIVKTSALGDIIQAFGVLDLLHHHFPHAEIDWIVEKKLESIVAAHPRIHQALALDLKKFGLKEMSLLRAKQYDLLFDLQGNCKSALITFLARAKEKIGFGRASVREWPNLLATKRRFCVDKKINIRLQYVQLVEKFLGETASVPSSSLRFPVVEEEERRVEEISTSLQTPVTAMVCPGAAWKNKQLSFETLSVFLKKVKEALPISFLLMWGNEEEKLFCEKLSFFLKERCRIVDKLPLAVWQNLMGRVDLLFAVDSSALHLCGTTKTPSFSVFGPTHSVIFKPLGKQHFAFQGRCPYFVHNPPFQKQCPLLRTCPSGACMKQIEPEALYEAFMSWWID